MIIYRVDCVNEDGIFEIIGHFLNEEDAKKHKEIEDRFLHNKKYGIVQNISEILVE